MSECIMKEHHAAGVREGDLRATEEFGAQGCNLSHLLVRYS